MAAVGSHLTLIVLTSSQQQPVSHNVPLKSLSESLKKYAEVLRSDFRQAALTSSYLAVLPDQRLKKTLQNHYDSTHKGGNLGFGKWHLLKTCSSGHQSPRRKEQNVKASTSHGGGVQCNLSPLNKMVDTLNLYLLQQQHIANGNRDNDSMTSSPSECLTRVATGIHKLMDRAPQKAEECMVVDVLWIAGESIPSPHSSVDLFGALLRLKKWHNAHLELITSGNVEDEQALCEWQEAIGVDVVCRSSEWRPSSGVLWRGAVNFTEHKYLKQAFNHSVSFPGFTLSLYSDIDLPHSATNVGDILSAVGVGPLFRPSHLEVMQAIRVSTLPLFWISPLHCKLSLSSINCSASKDMFRSLFGSDNGLGLLVCLCRSECDDKKTAGHRNTADWIEYVQGKDEEDILQHGSQLSPLAAYETGPVLLLTQDGSVTSPDQTNCNKMSCDAWFLWKPDAIDTGLFAQLKSRNMGFSREEDDSEMSHSLMELPILNFKGKQTAAFSKPNLQPPSRNDLRHLLSQLPHELELPPTEWPEIKALKTHEWIQRKMIRRLATPDLMFGRMVAPPPTSITTQLDSVTISDVLSCFTDRGVPATTSELSPIAMNDPRKLTRVHDPVEADDISYGAIISTTPSSKKQYHGVNYCLTADDTSLDVRLTKIQQRCLISERSSHCSTVITPKAERARQQSRRMKAAQSQPAGKKKEEKSEETEKKDEIDSTSTDRTEAVSDSAITIPGSGNCKSMPKKRAVLKPPRTSQYKSGPIKLMRSPVVKIPRSCGQRNISQKSSNSHIPNDVHSQAKVQRTNKGPISLSQANTSDGGAVLQTCALVSEAMVDNTQPDTEMELNEIHVPYSDSNTNDNVVCSDQPELTPVENQAVLGTTSENQDQSPVNSIDQPVIDEANRTLRRSPRLKKWRCFESGNGTKMKSAQSSSSLTEQRKEKKLKTQLGQEVVKALKKHDMPRSHPCFRRCYARLFKLSKSFLKDLKEYATHKADMREEMERVVRLNAPQVIEFEFKINQNA